MMRYTILKRGNYKFIHFDYDWAMDHKNDFALTLNSLLESKHMNSEEEIVNYIWRYIVVSDNIECPSKYLDEEEITLLYFENKSKSTSESKIIRNSAPPA